MGGGSEHKDRRAPLFAICICVIHSHACLSWPYLVSVL